MKEDLTQLILGIKGDQFCNYILSFKQRFPKFFPNAIFNEVGYYLFSCPLSFLESHSISFLRRILFAHCRMIRKIQASSSQRIYLKILEINPSTYGIAIALTHLHEYEIFNEKHIIQGIQNLIPGVKSIKDSYVSYQNSHAYFFYLEIKKVRGSFFSSDEKAKLTLELPLEFQQRIECIFPSLIFPGNEEEVFKSIKRLSEEIKYVHDLPQVMITFVEYSQKLLKFLVIVLRIIKPGSLSISSLSSQLPALVYFSLENVFCVGKLRKKYPKEAAVFTLEVSSSNFLRSNSEVNLRAARQYIVKALESVLGPYRDYNGGLLNKESEQLFAIKRALEKKKIPFHPFLEDLFYGIKPITMRALITAQTGIEIATLFRKIQNKPIESDQNYTIEKHHSKIVHIAIVKTKEKQWKGFFPQRILDYSSQIAYSCLEYEGYLYLCFFEQYPQSSVLFDAVQKETSHSQFFLADHQNHILRFNLQDGDPPSLNPRLASDMHCHTLCNLLFEGLTKVNTQGKIELAVAEKIDISSDGLFYTFYLRSAYWSNGEEVTAYHFERAWKKAIEAISGGITYFNLFSPIKNANKARQKQVSLDQVGVVAKDTRTLCVELESPCSYFLNIIATPLFFPLYGESEEPTHFNGPFTLAEWKHDFWIYLSQNPFYWDIHRIKLGGVKITMVSDPSTAYQMLCTGELDLIGDPISPISPKLLKTLKAKKGMIHKQVSRVFWIHCNKHSYPLHNINVRRALSLALNRKELIARVFIKQKPLFSPLPPKYSLLQGNVEGDPHLAMSYFKKALKELKLDQHSFPPLVITHSVLSFEKPLIEGLKAQWKEKLGIECHSVEIPWNDFTAAIDRGDFQLSGLFRRDLFNHSMFYLNFFKGSSYNPLSLENEEFEEILESYDQERDLKRVEALLMKEIPVIPIVSQTCFALVNKRIRGIDWNENGYLDLTKVEIDEKAFKKDDTHPFSDYFFNRKPNGEKKYSAEEINA